uniref:Carboxymuconolactone decarboxylase-like domain-containing protein n=1 Tax=Leptobrachium leishanense TaxID=445787 RepID=A0A8C5M1K1_9ANUR
MRILTRLIQLGRTCPAVTLSSVPVIVSNGLLRSPRSMTVGRNFYTTETGDNSRPISRYPIPYRKDLPYDMVELMEEVEKKGGFLPNVFKAMAHRPKEFRAFFAYYDCIMNNETGNLSKADKELIIVATSAYNRCPYCVTAHGALHRIYSKKRTLADQVTVNWDLADLNERDRAMVEFAVAIAKPENITDDHFQRLEKHGFDHEDAWDIASVTAFFALANRMAHLMDLRPNEEFYALGRVPKNTKE